MARREGRVAEEADDRLARSRFAVAAVDLGARGGLHEDLAALAAVLDVTPRSRRCPTARLRGSVGHRRSTSRETSEGPYDWGVAGGDGSTRRAPGVADVPEVRAPAGQAAAVDALGCSAAWLTRSERLGHKRAQFYAARDDETPAFAGVSRDGVSRPRGGRRVQTCRRS